MSAELTAGQCASLACLLEVTASKPGNVHRGADFEDLTFMDFVASSVAIAPLMESAADRRLGQTVLDAIAATRRVVTTNTNLGIVLLLAPLASVPRDVALADGVGKVLRNLDAEDARLIYDAVRLAEPGGLGSAREMDVGGDPPDNIIEAMNAAAQRDMVARQYTNDFQHVLQIVVPWLDEAVSSGCPLAPAVIHTHVRLMSEFPDSLIARKCGMEIARQSADRAAAVLQAGKPGDEAYFRSLADLDFWLRSDHHRRNPGTTADLVTAGLFAALREGVVRPPFDTGA